MPLTAAAALIGSGAIGDRVGGADRPALDIGMFRNRDSRRRRRYYTRFHCRGSFLVSLLFQGPRGFTPGQTGVVLLLTTIGMPLGGQLTGRLAHHGGLRRVRAIGTALLAGLYTIPAAVALGAVAIALVPLALTGFVAGILYSADTLVVLGSVDPARPASVGHLVAGAASRCGTGHCWPCHVQFLGDYA